MFGLCLVTGSFLHLELYEDLAFVDCRLEILEILLLDAVGLSLDEFRTLDPCEVENTENAIRVIAERGPYERSFTSSIK